MSEATRCDHAHGICISDPPCVPTFEELRVIVQHMFHDLPGHQVEDITGPIVTGELDRGPVPDPRP